MDVIIRNDLFTSYTGLIERVMRTNHRMLCTLSMEMEDIYQELSLQSSGHWTVMKSSAPPPWMPMSG